MAPPKFEELDKNNDGVITRNEFYAFSAESRPRKGRLQPQHEGNVHRVRPKNDDRPEMMFMHEEASTGGMPASLRGLDQGQITHWSQIGGNLERAGEKMTMPGGKKSSPPRPTQVVRDIKVSMTRNHHFY